MYAILVMAGGARSLVRSRIEKKGAPPSFWRGERAGCVGFRAVAHAGKAIINIGARQSILFCWSIERKARTTK